MPYSVRVIWTKAPSDGFVGGKYSRVHEWHFDGGAVLTASASPDVVPVPMSSEAAVDPEEAFVGSLSSCHMLWFLSLAADRGYIVTAYEDNAEGHLGKNGDGKLAMIRVQLRPRIVFDGESVPSPEAIAELHEQAHDRCFIANSVKTIVTVEPVLGVLEADDGG